MMRDAVRSAPHGDAVRRTAAGVAAISVVPRVKALDREAFRAAARKGLPFVVRGIVDRWPLSACGVDELLEQFGSSPVHVRTGDYAEAAFSARRALVDMTLSAYVESLGSTNGSLPPYAGNVRVPEIDQLCLWPAYFQMNQRPRVWLGPAGTVTPLHCDYFDNLFAQVWGSKHFWLFPPGDFDVLPTREVNPSLYASPFDPEQPDYVSWPLARQAHPVGCLVEAGELLFLPAGWFHHVRSIELSLSLNRWTEDQPLFTV